MVKALEDKNENNSRSRGSVKKVAFEYKIPPLKFYGIWLARRPNAPGSVDSEADI